MHKTLIDLYRHQSWADAEHWRALESHEGALQDKRLFERLHHIHLVQRAFLSIVSDQPPEMTNAEDYDPASLKSLARDYHAEVLPFLESLDEPAFEKTLTVPWFEDPPLELTVGEALLQAATHSGYHRGQNATRLRELGGDPPPVDYIVWLWKKRPDASWE